MEHNIKVVCQNLEQGKKLFQEFQDEAKEKGESVTHNITFYSSGMGRYFADIFTDKREIKIIVPFDDNDRIGDLFEEGDMVYFYGENREVLRKISDDSEEYFVIEDEKKEEQNE